MKRAISLMMAFVISFSVFAMLNTSVFAADNGDVKITFDANGGVNTGLDTYTVQSLQDIGKMPEAIGSTFISNSSVCNIIGGFAQPYDENKNPDILADIEYESRYGNRERYKPYKSRTTNESDGSVYRTRSIAVEAISSQTTADPADGYEVDVSVNFHYEYFYYDTEGKNPTQKQTFKWDETYELFPGGYHIDSYDEGIACYFKYFPFMESDFIMYDDIEHIDVRVDFDNEDSDLQFKLFLIKQWPMIDGAPVPANHPLILKDHAYRFHINEQHNAQYEIKTVDNTHATEEMMNVFTNANIYLDGTGFCEDYTYRVKTLSHNLYFTVSMDSLVKYLNKGNFYSFSGWYTKKTGGELVTLDKLNKIQSDTTLYAHWNYSLIDVNIYNYDINQNFIGKGQLYPNQSFYDLPNPERKGYTFAGWVDKDGNVIDRTQTIENYLLTNIYAYWQKVDEIKEALTKSTISVPTSSKTVNYKEKVKMSATASGLPKGYYVQWYDGNKLVGEKGNEKAIYTTEALTSTKTYSAVIVDSNNKIVSTSDQQQVVTIAVNNGFFAKLIAFFKGLFGAIPTVNL